MCYLRVAYVLLILGKMLVLRQDRLLYHLKSVRSDVPLSQQTPAVSVVNDDWIESSRAPEYAESSPDEFRKLLVASDDQTFCRWLGANANHPEKWVCRPGGHSADSHKTTLHSTFEDQYKNCDSHITPNLFYG